MAQLLQIKRVEVLDGDVLLIELTDGSALSVTLEQILSLPFKSLIQDEGDF